MTRRLCAVFVVVTAFVFTGSAQQPPPGLATLETTAESSRFAATSTYEDVVRFMKTVDQASPLVFYTTYGKTYEGRDMPLAVVGTGLKDASPAAVRATGKLRVHIQGNIHAGEVEGKESAQILLREIARGQHADWLQSTVLLVTPIFNADGNERFDLTNRGRQNGPINGQGTRANAQNTNINRDFMKLESPEARAFVKLWNDFDPHAGIDLHTSDGSTHGYYLTYSPPLNPATDATLMKVLTDEWFPFITRNIKSKHNWDTFYYGNVANPDGGRGRGRAADAGPGGAAAGGRAAGTPTPEVVGAAPTGQAPRAWATFEHVPRFHNNFVGMRNRFALLSEAYAYATFEDRIKVTSYFLDEALTFAHQNAARLEQVVAAADKAAIVGTAVSTRARIKRGGMIDILMGEVDTELNSNNQRPMNRRKDVVRPEPMIDMLWFESTASEDVPATFYVPAAAAKALDLLRAHGIQIRQVTQPVRAVEQFVIASNTARPAATNSIDTGNHQLRMLEGTWAAAPSVTVPAGAWAVPLNQPLGRLAFYLLAPTSDDGLVTWNFLDAELTEAKTYPILRKR